MAGSVRASQGRKGRWKDGCVMPNAGDIKAGGAYVEIYPDTSKLAATTESSVLQELRGSFGRGSEFGMLTQSLRGAGPLLGLTLAGRELAAITDQAIHLRDAFRDGSKSAGQITDELLRGLPIIGNLWATGRNIKDLLEGTVDDEKRLLSIEQDRLVIANLQRKQAEEAMKARDKAIENEMDFLNKMQIEEAGSPEDAERLRLNQEFDKRSREAQDRWAKAGNNPAADRERMKELLQIEQDRQEALGNLELRQAEKRMQQRHKITNDEADKEIALRKKDEEEQTSFATRMQRLQDKLKEGTDQAGRERVQRGLSEIDAIQRQVESVIGAHGGARGTFNAMAGQSLQGGANVNTSIIDTAKNTKMLNDVATRIWTVLNSGSLGLIPG
jgi:hypothetical protein